MDFLKSWNLELFNFILLNLSDNKAKDQRSVSLPNVSKEPKIHYNDGEKHSDKLQFVENKSDENFICDTFEVTLRRCKTVPVHNRASIKRYIYTNI